MVKKCQPGQMYSETNIATHVANQTSGSKPVSNHCAPPRLRLELDNPAETGTETGIPIPVSQNQIWIFKFRFWYERTRISMFKFWFRNFCSTWVNQLCYLNIYHNFTSSCTEGYALVLKYLFFSCDKQLKK